MKAIALVATALIGGLAGALFVDQLREEPDIRVSQPAPIPAPDSDRLAQVLERIDARQAEFERRLSGLESRGPTPTPDAGPGSGQDRAAPATGDAAAETTPAQRAAAIREMVGGIIGKPFGNREANRLFYWLTQNPDKVMDAIAELKAAG